MIHCLSSETLYANYSNANNMNKRIPVESLFADGHNGVTQYRNNSSQVSALNHPAGGATSSTQPPGQARKSSKGQMCQSLKRKKLRLPSSLVQTTVYSCITENR